MPQWLESAVFYEIYPQSFYDSNADGIGDIPGIIEKLDYVKSVGCNALWINPCFDSPFKDAGYDVRDYKKVAARYGSNEDLRRLFETAHAKNMRVLLDLVPGHTSEEHAWFQKSKLPQPNAFSNRYIWSDSWIYWENEGLRFVAGEAERNGVYIINFFKCQPALNYGFLQPRQKWQLPVDHPDCQAAREALKDVMRFWLEAGCDGFRVDMADSLVKFDDEQKTGTRALWQDVRRMLDAEFPHAALVSEWSCPPLALDAGFHADFALDHGGSGYQSLVRDFTVSERGEITANHSFFKKTGENGIRRFLDQYMDWYEKTKGRGYISLITGNHDTPRISYGLDTQELALAYAMLFTFPGVPFLYYGDEIGMRYIPGLPTKEGGYTRTGSRTPMQWSAGKNKGFSAAASSALYLPPDAGTSAPDVAAQEEDKNSLLATVKSILRLRAENPGLQARPNLEILYADGLPFVYRRENFTLAVNPKAASHTAPVDARGAPLVFSKGECSADSGALRLGPQSFGVWKKA
ncbi:MAG: hypothetical protein LBC72_00325 [Spirochaetaceae bacterium]|jgi:maltose alpha-D-glucosyltransferase/alpha-amylase|nr:hypothetical protein [Spirochaetaceae bacterium]